MRNSFASARVQARRIGGTALSALGLFATAWLTLHAGSGSQVGTLDDCCSAGDVLRNVLLFLPLGAGLALLGLRPLVVVALALVTSVGIELSQLWWVPGRFASVADVIANVAGCAIGLAIVVWWDRRARWWPRVAPLLAVAVVLTWFLGAHNVQPVVPRSDSWVARWAPPPIASGREGGQVLDARLQGIPLPDGEVVNVEALRARLQSADTMRLAVTLLTGSATKEPVRLFEIVVGQGVAPFLVLSQDGARLVAYQRLELSWQGLRAVWLTLEDVPPRVSGDTVHLLLEATLRQVRFVATNMGVLGESRVSLSPELYLSAIWYSATDGRLWWVLVPAMASFVLLGMALANRPRGLVVAGLTALVLGPATSGCAYPSWSVVAVALLGALAGHRLATSARLFPEARILPEELVSGLPTRSNDLS